MHFYKSNIAIVTLHHRQQDKKSADISAYYQVVISMKRNFLT